MRTNRSPRDPVAESRHYDYLQAVTVIGSSLSMALRSTCCW
ncbi:hypothetical protein ACHWUR_00410 [Klebsiella pneumoniae]